MPDQVYFYLFRHGQSQWNQQKLLQGQLDSPLTPEGEQQAYQLADKISHIPIHSVVSSVLGRAVQTAQICAAKLGLSHHIITGIEERYFGDWQGKPMSTLSGLHQFKAECYRQQHQNADFSGESTAQVQHRMQHALLQLASQQQGKKLLLISHGDALCCLMSLWTEAKELQNVQGLLLTCRQSQLHWGGLIE